MKILAIIPARGGSKRLPGKNIKELAGKPLIAYSIEHAKKSKYINRIIVSTDDKKIAKISRQFGAETPFIRPAELAGDLVKDFPVFEHTLNWLKDNETYIPDVVVQLRPTSPLRKVEDVDNAIQLLLRHPEADSVRTVIEAKPSPYKMYKITDDNLLTPIIKIEGVEEGYNLPTQSLPKAYRHIGTADVMWSKTIFDMKQMSGDKMLALIVEEAYQGIDKYQDWEFYEFLINRK